MKRNTLQLKCYMICIQISLGRNHDFHCIDALTFSALYTEYGWKHFLFFYIGYSIAGAINDNNHNKH